MIKSYINHAPAANVAYRDPDGAILVVVHVLRVQDVDNEDEESEINPCAEHLVVCECREATAEEAALVLAREAEAADRRRAADEDREINHLLNKLVDLLNPRGRPGSFRPAALVPGRAPGWIGIKVPVQTTTSELIAAALAAGFRRAESAGICAQVSVR